MSEIFKPLDPELLAKVREEAWSIENMEAHEADQNQLTYIGGEMEGLLGKSEDDGTLLREYYIDSRGRYWYRNRVRLSDGQTVNMDVYLFGKEIRARNTGRKRRRK